jgi:hypothetical protein
MSVGDVYSRTRSASNTRRRARAPPTTLAAWRQRHAAAYAFGRVSAITCTSHSEVQREGMGYEAITRVCVRGGGDVPGLAGRRRRVDPLEGLHHPEPHAAVRGVVRLGRAAHPRYHHNPYLSLWALYYERCGL